MIEVENLSKTYKTSFFSGHKACDNVSFVCPDGKITGLLGPNGAGKTTIIKTITASHYSDEGNVFFTFDGVRLDVKTQSEQCKAITGFAGENPLLYDDYTVKEFLAFVSELRSEKNTPEAELKRKYEKVLNLCGLSEVASQKISTLSHGFRQRLNFAQALIHDPKVLVLDEPSTGLDPSQIHEMRNLIKKISKDRTILFSTHILQEAELLCDHIVIINHGKICAMGSIRDLLSKSGKKTLEDAYLYFVENRSQS